MSKRVIISNMIKAKLRFVRKEGHSQCSFVILYVLIFRRVIWEMRAWNLPEEDLSISNAYVTHLVGESFIDTCRSGNWKKNAGFVRKPECTIKDASILCRIWFFDMFFNLNSWGANTKRCNLNMFTHNSDELKWRESNPVVIH